MKAIPYIIRGEHVSYQYIKENLDQIHSAVNQACDRSGRRPDDIQLVAVTKTVEADVMNAAVEFGVNIVGENRVQEIRRKFDDVQKGPKWHLIGHLQTNKVKYIIDKVDMIHSVDSFRLAEEISKRAEKADRQIEILLQVNVAGEDQKFGVEPNQLEPLIHEIQSLNGVKIKGLMLIAPYADDPEDVRPVFRRLKEIFDDLKNKEYKNVDLQYLSMGMTNDFEVAIEEGANFIRVGSGIFGARTYK